MAKVTRRRRGLIALCVALTLVLALLVLSALFMDGLFGMIQREPPGTLSDAQLEQMLQQEASGGTGEYRDPEDFFLPDTAVEPIGDENLIQILLIGQDRRGNTGRSLSDAMILCTLNREAETLTMTSFLRDTYVRIPGKGKHKLNTAYPIGGMPLLDATLKENFGVTVDGNIEVDFSQFEGIIDLLGGVEISLTGPEAAHLRHEYGFTLQEGKNRLNGKEALGYARIRRLGTDFGRTDRQRTVLTALIEQFRSAGPRKLHSVLKELLGMVTTDLSNGKIMGYALELWPMLKDLEIRSQRIPADGTFTFENIRGVGSCIIIDFEANRRILAETILDH